METQLTAVEWLETQFQKDNLSKEILNVFKRSFEQAKAMEKKNIIAFGYRCIGEVDSELGDLIYKKVPEEIYNETFKSE